MSGNRGYRRTTKTPGGYKSEPNGRIHMFDKTYIGFVKENRDAIRMGRLRVWIPELSQGDPSDQSSWYSVNYCSPFGGASRATKLSKEDANESQTSYGWWAVPPDLDNEVVVMFINGDPNRGIWVGCLYQQFMNHMIPGIANGTSPQEGAEGINPPVQEYNKRLTSDQERPRFDPLHEGLYYEGLYTDSVRGPSNASARRDDNYDSRDGASPQPNTDENGNTVESEETASEGAPPALVYGLKSPKGNHFYIDDAGDGMIRLRTANGAQILINDSVGYIYMISRNGNSWFQVSDEGIDMFSTENISLRAHKDINLHADGNLNQYATGSLNQVGQSGGTGSFHGGYNMLTDQLNLTSAGSVNIYSPTRVSISGPSVGIAATENIGITAGGKLGITSSGEMSLVGSKIKQNSGKGPQAKVEPIQLEPTTSTGSSGGGSAASGSSGSSGSSSSGGNPMSASYGPAGNTGAVAPPSPTGGRREDQAMRWFMSAQGGGYTKAQAAGIVGNLKVESSAIIDHKIHGDGRKAYGIAQWRGDAASGNRQGTFRRVYGKSIKSSTYEEQLAFVTWELANVGYLGDSELRRTTSATEAARVFMEEYERPSSNPSVNHISRRQQYASQLASKSLPGVEETTEETAEDTNAPPTQGGANENGPQVAPAPPEPSSSGVDIAEPIEASARMPSTHNDRVLDPSAQYPECTTYTTVSRLVTHEPFELHPTTPFPASVGGLGRGSMAVDPQGGDDVEGELEDPNAEQPDDGKKFATPMSGTITSLYGPRRSPTRGASRVHKGLDFGAPIGTPIIASKDGTVIKSGWGTGYGRVIYISHPGGWVTRYAHLSASKVRVGQEVKQGDVIGLCGNTGIGTGPHLHFEIRKGGQAVNPANYLPNIAKGRRVTRGSQKP